jgi:hypothetical protein
MRFLHTLIVALFLALLAPRAGEAAATILPPAETCFQATTGINGMLGALETITGGTGGPSGPTVFAGVTLTGGSGQNATANITVTSGAVTSVVILNPGIQYVVGDVLSAASANIGNVTGFSVIVNATTINSSLAGGSVYMYIPSTSTFKQTWQNAAQTILNTNPITLNQNGCAIIYGTGSYRQVLEDSLGNTVWDQITTDTSANNSYFFAGNALASGTANAIQITDTGFNATDGTIISFIPIATNTGPTTLNPSGFGNVPIVKDTSTGAVVLSGGEIVANSPSNIVEVEYSAAQGNFHILNLVASSGGNTVFPPLCSSQGLVVKNSSGTPGIFSITANQVVMTNTTNGTFVTRGTPAAPVSVSVNFSTTGAGGLDTGTVAVSTPYYVYIIDNGISTATSALGSLSSTAPTKPSGYAYVCRVGSMLTDGSAVFYQTQQAGAFVTYRITAGGNTALPPNIVNGSSGTSSDTSPVLTSVSLTGFIPPTATQAMLLATNNYKSQASTGNQMLAPSIAWGGTNNGPVGSNGLVWPFYTAASGSPQSAIVTINLEAQSFGWASAGAQGAVSIYGWKDSVNAN